VLLSALSHFVVPLHVLENKRLPEAVTGSVSLRKKGWGEAGISLFIIGMVVGIVTMMSLLFWVIYGYLVPDLELFWYLGDAWIAAAMLFMPRICSLAFIASTVGGITVVILCPYRKTGRLTAGISGNQPDG
jgi:hypothetical protein